MSSQDEVNYVVLSEEDGAFFSDGGETSSAEPNSARKTGKPSKKNRSEKNKKLEDPERTIGANVSSPKKLLTEDCGFCAALKASAEPIVGLALWETRAVASAVTCHKDKVVLRRSGELLFPKDASDVQRSKLLKKWWRSQHFGTRSVWVSVGTGDTIQKYFSHQTSEDKLFDILTEDAAGSVQESPHQTSFDYYLFDKKLSQDPHTGMMYACPRWSLLQYKKLVQDAGLLICGFGVPAMELAKVYRWLGPKRSTKFADCVLSLTESSATILILFGESAVYSRRIEHSSPGWDVQMDYLAQSLNDAFMYFQLYLSDVPVGRLHVTGMMPENVDMTEFLLMETGLVVDHWDPLSREDRLICSPKLKAMVPDLVVSSLGLALRRD